LRKPVQLLFQYHKPILRGYVFESGKLIGKFAYHASYAGAIGKVSSNGRGGV